MSNTRELGLSEIVTTSAIVSTVSAIGTGVGAAIRGGSFEESAPIVAAGAGLLTIGFGLFSKPSQVPPTPTQAILGFAAFEFLAAGAGYVGTKLFFNAATSTLPFVDSALGFPVSAGLYFCAGLAVQYYNQQSENTHDSAPKPHSW